MPLQACSGPEGSRKLRFSDIMTTAQDGGKVLSLLAVTVRHSLFGFRLREVLVSVGRLVRRIPASKPLGATQTPGYVAELKLVWFGGIFEILFGGSFSDIPGAWLAGVYPIHLLCRCWDRMDGAEGVCFRILVCLICVESSCVLWFVGALRWIADYCNVYLLLLSTGSVLVCLLCCFFCSLLYVVYIVFLSSLYIYSVKNLHLF
jgi:hypothetical protein